MDSTRYQGEGSVVLQGCRGSALDSERVELGRACDSEGSTFLDNDIHILVNDTTHCLVSGDYLLCVAAVEGGVVGGSDGACLVTDNETIYTAIVPLNDRDCIGIGCESDDVTIDGFGGSRKRTLGAGS